MSLTAKLFAPTITNPGEAKMKLLLPIAVATLILCRCSSLKKPEVVSSNCQFECLAKQFRVNLERSPG